MCRSIFYIRSRFENQQNIATRNSLGHEKTYLEISFWFSKQLNFKQFQNMCQMESYIH